MIRLLQDAVLDCCQSRRVKEWVDDQHLLNLRKGSLELMGPDRSVQSARRLFSERRHDVVEESAHICGVAVVVGGWMKGGLTDVRWCQLMCMKASCGARCDKSSTMILLRRISMLDMQSSP